MTTRIVGALVLLGSLATTACENIGQAMTAHTDVVARASGHELKVDRTASLIAANPQIPAQPDVVLAVANLWVDYTLLATAAAQDSTLRNINLDGFIAPILEQDAVTQLREQVIQVDTAITDEEVRRLFDESGMGSEIKARHILLGLPADATPAQRDSVTRLASDLRQRAASGADFAGLARQYSTEPGAAQSGGDLGYFKRGQMVAPFEDAAFKLQPGQISDIVETPFGLHIIKLEDRRTTNFDEMKAEFRQQAQVRKVQTAEENYVKGLTDSLNIAVEEGTYDVVKDLATKPETELRGRAASRSLVRYKGGSYATRDYLMFIRRINPQMRTQIPQRSDEELKNLLESLSRNKILVEEATRRKLGTSPARIDSLKNDVYGQLAMVTREAGLMNIQPQEGENRDQAIERRVNALLEATIKGEQNLIPLGPLAYALRDQFGGEVFERAVPAVVTKIEAARPRTPAPGAPQGPPPTPPDTASTTR